MILTRQQKKNKIANLICATRISNSIKNDKVIDYLDLLDSNGLTVSENLSITKKRSRSDNNNLSNKKNKTSYDYIIENGHLFEYNIINKIKQIMKNNNENKKLIEINESNIYLNSLKTINIIKNNLHTIILGSVIINSINNTWGNPDLIVKGCWINKYIKENIIGLNINKWYIIDIKSSIIQLINGGEDISTKLLYSVYKSQVYIYTQALNQSLSEYKIINDVEIGFIMGKKYKFTLNKNQIIKNSFDHLGIINFEKEKSNGINWNNIINSSINWINNLKINWKNFTLNPINCDELYPNMKNIYSKKWFGIKKNIAYKNKELSLLWHCGISNREKAWKHGIKSYMDKNLTPEILGFIKSDAKYKTISLMLELLNSNSNYILDNKNNYMEWQKKAQWEFFIDFETYNCDIDDDSDDDVACIDNVDEFNNIYTENQKIYMCGISWIDSDTSNLTHKSFVIEYQNSQNLKNNYEMDNNLNQINWNNYIECIDELDLIKKIKNFINGFKPNNMSLEEYFNKTRLIHWSEAEPVLYNKKINEYQLDLKEFKLNWYDLLKVFKYPKYPIIIKECFGFGLKVIVKKLNELKEIEISWSELDDGLLSSFIAQEIYFNKNNDSNKDSNKQMYEIIKYNWIDCKAMWILIEWMRKCITVNQVYTHEDLK